MLGEVAGALSSAWLGVIAVFLLAIFGALYRLGTIVGRLTTTVSELTKDIADTQKEQRSQGMTISRHETAIAVLQKVTKAE